MYKEDLLYLNFLIIYLLGWEKSTSASINVLHKHSVAFML